MSSIFPGSKLYLENIDTIYAVVSQSSDTLERERKMEIEQASLQEVLLAVKQAEQERCSRNVAKRLGPLIDFIDRYAKAVDVVVQGTVSPVTLAWGLLRGLIEVAGAFTKYFPKLIAMLETLGDTLCLYSEYAKLMQGDTRFQIALNRVYKDVLSILSKALTVFKKSGLNLMFRSIWTTFESDFRDTLASLARHKEALNNETTLSHRSKVQRFVDSSTTNYPHVDSLTDQILKWLSPVDCAQDLARESSKRAPGTGTWLFELDSFRTWYESSPAATLWISGPPGSGKTVLATTIIEQLRQRSYGTKRLLYFLGDKLDDQKSSLVSATATFLAQYMAQCKTVPPGLVRAFETSRRYGRTHFSASDAPKTLLGTTIGSGQPLDVVVDGLDEFCDIAQILGLLETLSTCMNQIHIVVLSRDFPKIRHALASALHIELVKSPMKQDIEASIRFEIQGSLIEDPELREKVIRDLIDKADNSFLWTALVLQDVAAAVSLSQIEQIMADLPKGLGVAYGEIFHKLSQMGTHKRNLSRTAFLWICCSLRPLNWAELQCALANAMSGKPHSADHLPFKPAVLEVCGNLIRYEAERDILQPIHLSVRDYLVDCTEEDQETMMYRFPEPHGHAELAKQCLEYLSKVSLPSGRWDSVESPMLSYATKFWCPHTSSSTYNTQLDQVVKQFLSDSTRRRSWLMNMLFWDMENFPLNSLIRMQARLSEWARAGRGSSSPMVNSSDTELDWIIDITDLLLHMERRKGVSYFSRATSMRDLARILTQTGKLNEAVTKIEIELSSQKEGESYEQPWLMNVLGVLYDQQGKVELSLGIQQRAFERQKTRFGTTHSESVWTINEMGRIFRHLDQLKESEEMHCKALHILIKLESDDMEIAWTKSTLARTHRKQGRFREALELSKGAFEINASFCGEDHPHCLWLLNDIGQCYRYQGMHEQAETVFRQAWEKRVSMLGANHSDTLWSANNLGVILAEMDRPSEALDVQTAALEAQERSLGPQHQFTIWTREVVTRLKNM